MNINDCRGKRYMENYCAFRIIRKDPDTGKLEDFGCSIKSKDIYNVAPETDRTGNVIYNQPLFERGIIYTHILVDTPKGKKLKQVPIKEGTISNLEVDPLGPNIIWENISNQHEHGLTYNYPRRRGDSFDPDIHPYYSKVSEEIPSSSGMLEEEQVGEIFGERNITLVSTGWRSEKFFKIPPVENCSKRMYGKFDRNIGIPRHKSMRDYQFSIENWVNYSSIKDTMRKECLFIESLTDDEILKECKQRGFNINIANALIEIRNGAFLNLREIMRNNGVHPAIISKFVSSISTYTKKSIYRSFNPRDIFHLYTVLPHMKWTRYYTDANGRTQSETKTIDKDFMLLLKCNILNYMLNYPGWESIDLESTKVPVSDRYWYAGLMIIRAQNDNGFKITKNRPSLPVFDSKMPLPDHIIRILKKTKDLMKEKKKVSLFKEEIDIKDCGEFSDAVRLVLLETIEGVSTNIPDPNRLYPAMMRIQDIVDDWDNGERERIFSQILKAGEMWSPAEIKLTWKHFKKHWKKDPGAFWREIERMRDYGEGVPIFTENLSSKRESRESFSVREPTQSINSNIPATVISGEHDEVDVFAAIAMEKDRALALAELKEMAREEGISVEDLIESIKLDSLARLGIDPDEYGNFSEEDPDGRSGPMIPGREDSWE